MGVGEMKVVTEGTAWKIENRHGRGKILRLETWFQKHRFGCSVGSAWRGQKRGQGASRAMQQGTMVSRSDLGPRDAERRSAQPWGRDWKGRARRKEGVRAAGFLHVWTGGSLLLRNTNKWCGRGKERRRERGMSLLGKFGGSCEIPRGSWQTQEDTWLQLWKSRRPRKLLVSV